MKWMSISVKVVALAVVALALGTMTRGASAQYPPPTGGVSLEVSSSTATAGSSVAVSAKVIAPNGTAVSGISCTFAVVSQPGSDAAVNPGPFTSDANGVVTSSLAVGTTPGSIIVGVQCGELSSRVSVVVSGAAQGTGTGTGADAGAVFLPSTGTGPMESAFFGVQAVIALLACGIVALAAGSALMLRARRVRAS